MMVKSDGSALQRRIVDAPRDADHLDARPGCAHAPANRRGWACPRASACRTARRGAGRRRGCRRARQDSRPTDARHRAPARAGSGSGNPAGCLAGVHPRGPRHWARSPRSRRRARCRQWQAAVPGCAMQRELSWREPNVRLDQFAREAHPLRIGIDLRAGLLEDLARTGMEKVHADFLEHGQGRLMDGLQFVARHRRHRLERKTRLGLRLGGATRLGVAALRLRRPRRPRASVNSMMFPLPLGARPQFPAPPCRSNAAARLQSVLSHPPGMANLQPMLFRFCRVHECRGVTPRQPDPSAGASFPCRGTPRISSSPPTDGRHS